MHNNTEDIYGMIAYKLLNIKECLLVYYYLIVNKISAWYWKVLLGKNCRFYGKVYFRRIPCSSITIGEKCRFRSAVWSNFIGLNRPCMITTLKPNAEIKIGKRCGFSGTIIAAATSIIIDDDVMCGANITITDTDWHGQDPNRRHNDGATAPIYIGKNVWLGMNVIVMKGVTIGENSVICLGSIVTKSIPPNSVALGQPAQVIKRLK